MKLLVDPLLWFFIVELIFLTLFWQEMIIFSGAKRVMLISFVVISLLLALLSIGMVSQSLKRSLLIKDTSPIKAPEYIFVLGAGYYPGDTKANDTLNSDAIKRTQTAVNLWRKYPNATLVMQGAEDSYPFRKRSRAVVLMAEFAAMKGVPKANIITEGQSLNTREHPLYALRLAGVSAESPVVVVTSSWHLRRARGEFTRYFKQPSFYAVVTLPEALSLKDFIPSTRALNASTTYLREWVGLLWYKVRFLFVGNEVDVKTKT